MVVSKSQTAGTVRDLVEGAGSSQVSPMLIGENYLQEAVDKMVELADLRDRIEWQLIGPLQSNKTRVAAERFDGVQSVDRLKIAERLSAQRPPELGDLSVCIQVNIDAAPTKHGVSPAELPAIAAQIARLPRLKLRGLMAIPEPADTLAAQRAPHARMKLLFDALRAQGLPLDTLSIGMSADLEAAIAEGSTMVRVGTAVFGARA